MITAKHQLLLFASLAASFGIVPYSTQLARCQPISWTNPAGGFYGNANNWTPSTVPTTSNPIIFGLPGGYDIGFQSNQSAESFAVSNGANVNFVDSGNDSPTRLIRVAGGGSIENARLQLRGDSAGALLIMLLDENLNIRGELNALQIVDNARVLNRSSVIDANGSVTVRGALASWRMSEDLRVRGEAVLSIQQGGLVNNQNDIMFGGTSTTDMSNGFAFVEGVGDGGEPSSLTAEDGMTVGSFGTGRLFVNGGALVDVENRVQVGLGAGSTGNISIEGVDASGNPSTMNTGLLTMGRGGDSRLSIRAGGRVNSDSATVGDSSSANVNVFGGNRQSTWNITNTLRIGSTANGIVSIEKGARLVTGNAVLGLSNGTTGQLFVIGGTDEEPTTIWENHGVFAVGGNETQPLGRGTFQVAGDARAQIGETVRIWENGVVFISNGGTLSADTIEHTHNGTFDFREGTLAVNRFEGDLLNMSGTLAPGVTGLAGLTTVVGEYTQQSDATLSISIGGSGPGSEHDLVNVAGDTLLDGLLELSLTGGYAPESTDMFTVLAADSLFGTFDNVFTGQRLDTADGLGSFVVNYGIGSAFDETRIVLSDFRATLPGDFDIDGDVDGGDFLAWQRNPSVGNLSDWEDNFGSSIPGLAATIAVPEPATGLLLLIAATVSISQRRRDFRALPVRRLFLRNL